MTDAPPPALKIGVALALIGDVGEVLADAKAIEAAGAESLWVFGDDDTDQYVVLAALAAVTWRVRLASPRPERTSAKSDQFDLAHATCARIARGRLLGSSEFVLSDKPADEATALFTAIRSTRPEVECWMRTQFPDGRAAWDELRRACTEAGATGVVLPNDPRLIDLLRNPDVVEDRSDLKLSFG